MATPQFVQTTLIGAEADNWTSLQFGPDGRLYASKVDGTIAIFTIETTVSGYQVTAVETLDNIKQITNYDDDGTLADAAYQGTRQVTGILVTGGTSTSAVTTVSLADTPTDPARSEAAAVPLDLVGDPESPALYVPPPLVATIVKDTPIGTPVADVDAVDPEGGELTYSLEPSTDTGAYDIDPATGVITVADPTMLEVNKGRDPDQLSVVVDSGETVRTVKVSVAVSAEEEQTPSDPTTVPALAVQDVPVVLYVSSSDPRIGAGPGGGDVNLDTNSSTISRLTQTETGWERVDLVRGLPRSEENHSANGMQLSADGTKLYVAVGSNTNEGAPSNNFAYTPEYAYSAAILVIDLVAIDAMATRTDAFGNRYKYDLPTLDGNPNDPNMDDPFGGFDGFNQAIIDPNGPVQIYSPGYRNAYDLVLTEAGRLYTVDNGSNAGWGGPPVGEGPAVNGQSSITNQSVDGGPETLDHLHLVTEGYYGGFPNPIRANPTGAGWNQDGTYLPPDSSSLPAGWPPVPVSVANTLEGDFHSPGQDGALYSSWLSSTNGIEEYTATTFEGAMQGNLLTVTFGDDLFRVVLNADGTAVTSVINMTGGSEVGGSGIPLDVTAQGDNESFAGTIWVANYGGPITIFTPTDDAPPPPDADADDDGLEDSVDPFAVDPNNGRNTDLAAGQTLVWNFSQNIPPPGPQGSLLNMGFTGLMTNGVESSLGFYDPNNIKAGGAAAGFQVEAVPASDAAKAHNNQQNGFQFGVDVRPEVENFVIEVKMDNPFGGDPSTAPTGSKTQGFFIGSGDQDNYLKIVAHANGGQGGIEVANEKAGSFSAKMYAAAIAGASIQTLDTITLRLAVDVDAGIVTPNWTYTVGGTAFNGSGNAVQLSGATLAALQGTYTVEGVASALGVGIISSSVGSNDPFPAFWESIRITADGAPPPAAGVTVVQSGGIAVAEEGATTDTFTAVLDRQPTADVTITVAGDADVGFATGAGPITLTFTTQNWNAAQTVTVKAQDDTDVEGPHTGTVTLSVASSDTAYNGLSIDPVSVSVTDNDLPPPPPPGSDDDGDGISDTLDRFALDPDNGKGAGSNLEALNSITLNFDSLGSGPLPAGFTGVMTNLTKSYEQLFHPAGVGVSNGKLQVVQSAGDASKNNVEDAFQFGVDTAGVMTFTIETKVDNPFYQNAVSPTGFRQLGFQIGTGEQNAFAKLVLNAFNGSPGVELLVEGDNGSKVGGTKYALGGGVALADVASATLYLDVAVSDTTAALSPRWDLFDAAGTKIGGSSALSTQPFTVPASGNLLAALKGEYVAEGQPSGLAVGVIGSSYKSSGSFTAAWDYLKITETGEGPPSAGVTVVESGGATAVTEGGATDSFVVALASQPTANVTITVADGADLNVGAGSATPGGSTTLTFTPQNWNVAQTVTVAAVDDALVEGAETANITLSAASSDTAYSGLAIAPVAVAIADNDQAPSSPRALLSITPASGINGSTFIGSSMKLENLSPSGQELTTFTIDLTNSVLAGMIFDPTGQAGDKSAKAFTVDQANGFTVVGHSFGGGTDATGYRTLTVQLQDFDPGEQFLFSVDVDPSSIRGVGAPGPGESGSVAGVEMTGSLVSFGFGGTSLTNEIFKGGTGVGGGVAEGFENAPAEPIVAVVGVSGNTATVSATQQTVQLTGPAGATVRVLVLEGAQFTAGVPAAAPDLGTYEANSAVQVTTTDVVLDGSGHAQTAITLTQSVAEGGLNYVTAAVLGASGATGLVSTPIALKLGSAPSSPGVTVVESGGATAVTEGGATDSFTVALASQPTANVTITVADGADLNVGAGSATPGASATLTFTPQNWNVAQTVTAVAVDDTVVEGAETANITLSAASSDSAYSGLAIAPVAVAITDNDQAPGTTIVLDGSTALTGSLGSQMWGGVSVSATGWNAGAALVTKSTYGLGVSGGRYSTQVDHNASTGASELLRLDFGAAVDAATVRIGRMSPAENGHAEVGAWQAYDAANTLVGQGVLDPRGQTAVGSLAYDFVIDPAADFSRLELTTLPYDNGSDAGTADSSDFALTRIAYEVDAVF